MSYAATIVKSLQRGTITIGAGVAITNTVTITAVTMGKSVIVGAGYTGSDGSTAPHSSNTRLELTNATTVTVTRVGSDANTGASQAPYQVLEYY